MEEIKYEKIMNKVGILISRDYPTTTAQTAANYGYIFTAPFPFEVLSIIEKHDVAGTVDATLDVQRVPNGTTLASGTTILSSTFSLTSAADTAVMKQGLDLTNNRKFDPFDSISLVAGGTLTTLAGVQVTIYIRPLGMGDFRNYGNT